MERERRVERKGDMTGRDGWKGGEGRRGEGERVPAGNFFPFIPLGIGRCNKSLSLTLSLKLCG